MTSRLTPSRPCGQRFLSWIPDAIDARTARRAMRGVVALAALAVLLAAVGSPGPAHAWRHGRVIGPGAGYVWGSGPWVPFPFQRPSPDYRYSAPLGAPLSYDDPEHGTTYCWSHSLGFYFVCGYGPPAVISVPPVLPAPPRFAPPIGEPTASPASGVLLFRLPQGAEATINGVPIGLSDGFGIHALPPGTHTVVVHASGKATAHTVNVRPHKIFTVTPTGIVAAEP